MYYFRSWFYASDVSQPWRGKQDIYQPLHCWFWSRWQIHIHFIYFIERLHIVEDIMLDSWQQQVVVLTSAVILGCLTASHLLLQITASLLCSADNHACTALRYDVWSRNSKQVPLWVHRFSQRTTTVLIPKRFELTCPEHLRKPKWPTSSINSFTAAKVLQVATWEEKTECEGCVESISCKW